MRARAILVAVAILVAATSFSADGGFVKTMLVAHAGMGYGAPQNTLPAYQAAIDAGFGFECDIQMSADHQIFAAHNSTASSYGGRDAPFKEMMWSEISQIDVGLRLGGQRWAGTYMPRFEDILAVMRDGCKSFVEVKEAAGTEIVPYIKAAVEAQNNATPNNMLFISFDREICRALRQALPDYEVLWIIFSHKDLEVHDDQRGPAYTASEVIDLLREANLTGVDMACDKSVVTEAFVRQVTAAGFKFGVWTVDSTDNARIFLKRGVDAVTTNRTREIAEELEDVPWRLAEFLDSAAKPIDTRVGEAQASSENGLESRTGTQAVSSLRSLNTTKAGTFTVFR